jgi:hypothetical protein
MASDWVRRRTASIGSIGAPQARGPPLFPSSRSREPNPLGGCARGCRKLLESHSCLKEFYFFPICTSSLVAYADRPRVGKKGYLVTGHYYFLELEKRHYYSRILKFVITIFNFPQICHKIRMKTSWSQLQAYTKTYISFSCQ